MLDNFDCLNLICKNLCYIDILSLKYTCKKFSSLNFTLPSFKDIFIKRLLEGNVVPTIDDAIKFCDNLYDTGAYVAGSFILDCLYETNYHNDIDVYDHLVPENLGNICLIDNFGCENLKFTQSLYKSNFESIGSISETDLTLRNFINKYNPSYSSINFGSQKEFGYNTVRSKNLIQIIPVNLQLNNNERSVIPRFIKASFDLDICQSFFDGKKLCIKNIFKLMYKYDFIKPNTKFMLQIYDIDKKYVNNVNCYHGDKIKISSEDEDLYENKSTEDRINKYINRGFDIKYHPKYNEIKLHIKETFENNKYCKIHNCSDFGNCNNKNHPRNNISCIADSSINLSIY
jgi:hypothetical protein